MSAQQAPPRAVALPLLGRMVFVSGLIATAYAAALLVQNLAAFRHPWLVTGLLLASALAPALLADVARRGAELPSWGAWLTVGTVFGVSLAVPALLPAAERVNAAWNWGTGGMTLLALAAFRPIAWSAVLGVAHALLAVVVARHAGLGWLPAEVAAVSASLPAVAASAYLRFYADAVRSYATALSQAAQAQAARGALETLQMADNRRLAALREDCIGVLEDVVAAGGDVAAGDAARARQLAEALRATLVQHRRSLWLPSETNGAPVRLVARPDASSRLDERDRAWLTALIRLLGEDGRTTEVRVVVDLAPDRQGCDLVVTARRASGRGAPHDDRVLSLCTGRRMRIEADDDLVVVEGRLG